MKFFVRALTALALAVATVVIIPAAPAAIEQAIQLQDCLTTDNPICIKTVEVKAADRDSFTKAKLTGLEIPVDQIGNGGLRIKGVRQEYQTPGIFYEGANNDKIVPTVEFYPAVTVPCPIASCSPAREVIGVFVSPSELHDPWQDRLVTSPFRSDSNFCNAGNQKAKCVRNLNFGSLIKIRMQLQLPTSYVITFIHGLAQKFSYSQSPSEIQGYSLLTFEFSPIEHSGMLSSEWGTNSEGQQGGDYIVDATALWFFGKNDMWSKSIGPCAGSGAYGVVNNAVEMGEPQWNSQDSTINVRLKAPHVNSRNEVAKGYFGAFVSRKMAECLWNLDISTRSSAKLSISYSEGGKAEVLTAVSSYKDELFSLESSGFHYSSPTVKVKLEGEVKTIALPTASPKTVNLPRTITCSKGKILKRVTALSPKCPKGYKQK